MMRTCVRLGVVTLLVAMGLSCTNTDPVRSGNSEVLLQIQLTNPNSRYEFALVTLARIDVSPLDPQAQAALGSNSIGALPPSAAQAIDFADPIPPVQTVFSLGAGSYQVNTVQIGQVFFFDEDFAGAETDCQTQNVYEIPAIANLNNLGPQFQFTVDPGDASTLMLNFDGQGFAAALESASSPIPGGGGQCQVSTTQLSALAGTFLTLQ